MSRKEFYRGIYKWKLDFYDGRTIFEDSINPETNLPFIKDPNGEKDVKKISLISKMMGYPSLEINVPSGCIPVFFFENFEDVVGNNYVNMVMHVGYHHRFYRLLQYIDMSTRIVGSRVVLNGIN